VCLVFKIANELSDLFVSPAVLGFHFAQIAHDTINLAPAQPHHRGRKIATAQSAQQITLSQMQKLFYF
jgi:hypothetical protein